MVRALQFILMEMWSFKCQIIYNRQVSCFSGNAAVNICTGVFEPVGVSISEFCTEAHSNTRLSGIKRHVSSLQCKVPFSPITKVYCITGLRNLKNCYTSKQRDLQCNIREIKVFERGPESDNHCSLTVLILIITLWKFLCHVDRPKAYFFDS